MLRHFQLDCESTNLTEDDDSRDTIINSEINSPRYDYQCNEQPLPALPPLIPIPKVNYPIAPIQVLNKNFATLSEIKPKVEKQELGIHNQFLQKDTTTAGTPESATPTHTSTRGKLVLIKKNNKLYKIIIPHNVMPTTCDTSGPVVINIPEVGPLVIKIDHQINKEPTTKFTPLLEPFSLNFDEIMEKVSTAEMVSQQPVAKRTSSSSGNVPAPKRTLYCWENYNMRTRSKLNYTYGFSKKERVSTRRCFNLLNGLINKKKSQLQRGNKYCCKINNDENNYCAKAKDVQSLLLPHHTTVCFSNFDELHTSSEAIRLNDDKEKINKSQTRNMDNRKRKKNTFKLDDKTPPIQIGKRHKHPIPCYTKIVRNKQIENMCLSLKHNSPVQNIKNCPGNTFKDRVDKFNSLVIEDPKKFVQEVDHLKPILVINMHNFPKIKFETEYSKTNIVFAVNKEKQFCTEILESCTFFEAVTKGYVNLVDSDILCSYIKGK